MAIAPRLRRLARRARLAAVAPVVNTPWNRPCGRPSRSAIHCNARFSTAAAMEWRSVATFWSNVETSQSAASAAGVKCDAVVAVGDELDRAAQATECGDDLGMARPAVALAAVERAADCAAQRVFQALHQGVDDAAHEPLEQPPAG